MLWTLAAFLLILSLAVVNLLKKVANSVKKSIYIIPSDATIDQAFPEEIMEHMMTFLDPRAMIECRLVSKYWHHHTTKPNIEMEVIARARRRLREVFAEIRSELYISRDEINYIMESKLTKDMSFVRASAIASKHGAELVVADSACKFFLERDKWNRANFNKKYFLLILGRKCEVPWQFCVSNYEFGTIPMFDTTSVDWHDTANWTTADIMIDAKKLPMFNQQDVKLYLYRPHDMPKYFYFIPFNHKLLHTLLFLFAPIIVHDALQSNFLPTIKSWFGPILFIWAVVMQILLVRSLMRYQLPAKDFKITLAVYSISYILLTYVAYPASMSVFAGIGVQALMFVYTMLSKEYFLPYNNKSMTKKKWQVFITGALLIFLMIDWKLVVESVRDLTIFRTLFENTFCYCIILLHFMIVNFLALVQNHRANWRLLFAWDPFVVWALVKSYAFVILTTLIAPTWRGNHL